jgi:histidinol phosphatase-like enzyme
MLDNGLNRLAELYFSQKDADTLHNKMNQSFAAAL